MSVHLITMEKGHKVARPIVSRQEYLRLRNTSAQQANREWQGKAAGEPRCDWCR